MPGRRPIPKPSPLALNLIDRRHVMTGGHDSDGRRDDGMVLAQRGDLAKRSLRAAMRRARQAVAPVDARRMAREACERLLADARFAGVGRIVLYDAIDAEIDVVPIRDAGRSLGKRLFYPSMVTDEIRFLEDIGEPHRRGRWGIREPESTRELERDAQDILFVVPGVAFDLRGHRLGRGYGAYDRALAKHGGYRIGMAYEFQIVPALPRDSWDVPMHVVLTDARRIDAHPYLGGMEEPS